MRTTRHAGVAGLLLALSLAACTETKQAALPTPPAPQPPPPPATAATNDPRAAWAIKVFADACATKAGRPEATRQWAESHRLNPILDADAAKFLGGKPGTVWSASGEIGQFAILLHDDGTCWVWARRAEADEVNRLLDILMAGVARPPAQGPRINVAREVDREVPGAGGPYRQVAYSIRAGDAPVQFMVSSITTRSADAEVQVRLLTRPIAAN